MSESKKKVEGTWSQPVFSDSIERHHWHVSTEFPQIPFSPPRWSHKNRPRHFFLQWLISINLVVSVRVRKKEGDNKEKPRNSLETRWWNMYDQGRRRRKSRIRLSVCGRNRGKKHKPAVLLFIYLSIHFLFPFIFSVVACVSRSSETE